MHGAGIVCGDKAVLTSGVTLFLPHGAWTHTCRCVRCTANFEAFHLTHLLRPRGDECDSSDDDDPVTVDATPSGVARLDSATPPHVDPVAVVMTGRSPVLMASLETAGLAALSQLPQPAQIAALTKYNAFSEQLRGFLKGFAEEDKVVTEGDIRGFMTSMESRKRPRSSSR